jgi:nitroimidazol reductase NimA-like FMN-containing flavoprotein (pyridoxamine 5'-phosphate oxidase superfamily)
MMRAMRKANREIKDPKAVRAIMEEARVCRIGLSDDGMPYIVPMNFGLGEDCIYLHCAAEGRKLDIIRRNDRVCFEMDLFREVVLGQSPCGCSARYESVIGFGRASIVEEPGAKRTALDRIMEHNGVKGAFIYQDDILEKTTVVRIAIESLTAKRRE